MLAIGMKITIIAKYRMEAICPIMMKGYSTGCPPIHVSRRRSATRVQ